MAEPILFKVPLRDRQEELFHKLENAPREHTEALLAGYDVLQGLHEAGLLEVAKGLLGSGDKVLEILVKASDSPDVIRGIRNLIILTKLFGALDPKLLEHLADAVPDSTAKAKTEKPLGPFQLLGKATNQDTRRALTFMLRVAEALGKGLDPEKPAPARTAS